MDLKRGDIVRVADGKPRPAVIVQADGLPTPAMILICPLTSTLTDAPLYRVTLEPDAGNNLVTTSQCMVDRIGAVRRDRLDGRIGRMAEADMQRLNVALMLMLDVAG